MLGRSHKLAVIVPYRDREAHLRAWLPRLRARLLAQRIAHDVIVVEQAELDQPFNRGRLLNIGVAAARDDHDYFCFHDVDLVPEGERCDYRFARRPTHLSAHCSQFAYALPFQECFGGVVLVSRRDFLRVNGFSNHYWGWGGEDDDLRARLVRCGLRVARRNGRYASLPHPQSRKDTPDYARNVERLERMQRGAIDPRDDGYDTLPPYAIVACAREATHTRMTVRFAR